TFWLGLLLIVLLASGRGFMPGLFPTGGMVDPHAVSGWRSVLSTAQHMVLPVTTMVAVVYAQYLMIMRSSLMDEKGADYLTTARAKGLRDALVRRRHAVPHALLPTVTLIFLNLGQVVSGVILVETVFSWPGLGRLFYFVLRVPDLGLVQGLFVVFAASVILMNLLADLVYPLLDPWVRPCPTTPPSTRTDPAPGEPACPPRPARPPDSDAARPCPASPATTPATARVCSVWWRWWPSDSWR